MKSKFERISSFSKCEVFALWLRTVQSAEDAVDTRISGHFIL